MFRTTSSTSFSFHINNHQRMVNNNNITKMIHKYLNTVKNSNKEKNINKNVGLKGKLKTYILKTFTKMSLKST